MTIHTDHPFVPDPDERDRTRRFRGRLTAPVTIVTAGTDDKRTGLTVSSLIVIEGEPPQIFMVVGPTSDLWDVTGETGRLVVHVCGEGDNGRSEVFAGLRPSPGGVFAGSSTEMSEWGPVLTDIPDRAFCTVSKREEIGYSGLVTARIDEIEVSNLSNPLVYFRGRYRALA
jgi:3-hydroxy-9,10-secoandrosta-1,3,5(10)-triene-9,17-dione monooxygenase reductase component